MSKKRNQKMGIYTATRLGVLLTVSLLLAKTPLTVYAEEVAEEAVIFDVTNEETLSEDLSYYIDEEEPTEEIIEEPGLREGDGDDTETIDENLTLTSDQTITGNVVLNADLHLNGHTLHVTGDLRHLKGEVKFNEGTLLVDGNYIAQSTELDTNGKNKPSYGTLNFEKQADKMVVGGDFLAQSGFGSTMSAGVLELKGNVTDLTGNTVRASDSSIIGGTHVAIFSGTGKQVVELDGNSYFNIIHTENTDVQFKRLGFVELDQDVTLTGDVEDIPWLIKLNGHTLTVNGNVTKSANTDVNINKGTFHITGDFRHLYGEVKFNEGTLLVDGNYIAQSTELDTNGKNKPSYGTLKFEKQADKMVVGGDFLAQSGFGSTMSAGVLELKGNVTDLTGNTVRASDSSIIGGTHVAIFSGTGKQVVELDGNSYFNIIHTENTDVQFKRLGFVELDQDVTLTGDVEDIPWLIKLNGHTLTVNGNVTKSANTDVNINKGTFHITGDFRHISGTVNFNEGTLIIDGNYIAQSTDKDDKGNYKDSTGTLVFENKDDHMKVVGNFFAQSVLSGRMNDGLLEIGGDVTDNTGNTIYANHNISKHKTILIGSGHQTVTLKKAKETGNQVYFFHFLEIIKPRSNYTFNPDPCWYGDLIIGKKDPVPLTALTLTSDTMLLNLYESNTIGVIKTPADADDEITFTSSDPSVAYVDAEGQVTGLKVGKTTVTVRGGKFEAKCEVTVRADLTGVILDKTEMSLTVGQDTYFTATPYPLGVECSYVWGLSVDNASDDKVSDYFKLTTKENEAQIIALKPCEAELKVTVTDDGGNAKSAVAKVTVTSSDLMNNETITDDEKKDIIDTFEDPAKVNSMIWISGLKDKYEYDGAPVEPAIDVYCGTTRLRLGKDYTLTYSNNKSAPQTGRLTIKGKGSYTGTTGQNFNIVDEVKSGDKSIKKATVTGLEKSYPYTGSPVEPAIELALSGTTLTKGIDYTVSYSRNTDAGTATLYIAGIGEYKDTLKKTFKITAVNITQAKNTGALKVKAESADYRPGGAVPLVIVTYTVNGKEWTLRDGTDYKLSFTGNKTPGSKGTVTVTGQGNFTKKTTETYDVTAGDLSGLTMSVTDLKYKAKQKKASAYQSKVTIIDKDGKNPKITKDYVLTYTDISAGIVLDVKTSEADLKKVNEGDLIKVTATEGSSRTYKGELTGYYRLSNPKNINTAKAGVANQVYNGKEKTPEVSLTWSNSPLDKNKDYTIAFYRNNVNKGTAYMTVIGLGDYSGTKNVSFKIAASNVDDVYLGKWNGKEFKQQ